MLRMNSSIFALTASLTLALFGAVACGSDDGGGGNSGGAGGSGGSGGSGGGSTTDQSCSTPTGDCRVAPAEPTDAPTGDGTTPTVVALNSLLLGDKTRDGTLDSKAWKDYGFNLDGLVSTRGGKNHCKPAGSGTVASIQPDGNGGIDNSFGANLLGLITTLAADASDSVNESITDGDFTVILRMSTLGSGAEQKGIAADLFGGAKLGSTPAFDGSDVWPVMSELLNDPADINSSKVKFGSSFVTGGTWYSGTPGTLSLALSVSGFTLTLNIRQAIISTKITGAGTAAAAGSDGIIGGVLDTEELVSELKKVAGTFDESLCDGSTFESIASSIRAASDIMADGTNGDSSKTCDGISIGLGFSAKAVQLGTAAPPATPGADPCNP